MARTGAAARGAAPAACLSEEGFRAIYEQTCRGLWAYLARVSRDPAAADDLLQETYHRYLRAAPAELAGQGAKNYLYRVATNLLRDRRRRSRPEVEIGESCGAAGGAGPVETGLDLRRAMGELSERDRQLLWLAYAEGFSHREIAGALGLAEESVRPMLHRARNRLGGLLRQRGYGQGGAR